jgi:hypothetical protein
MAGDGEIRRAVRMRFFEPAGYEFTTNQPGF